MSCCLVYLNANPSRLFSEERQGLQSQCRSRGCSCRICFVFGIGRIGQEGKQLASLGLVGVVVWVLFVHVLPHRSRLILKRKTADQHQSPPAGGG